MRNDIIFGIGVFLAVAFISGLSLYYAAPPANMKQVHDGENVYSYFDQSDFLKFTSYDGGYGCVMGGDFIADFSIGLPWIALYSRRPLSAYSITP